MNNKEAVEKFEQQLHGAYIEKLFWIAASWDIGDLKDFIEDLRDEDWFKIMPELKQWEYFQECYKDNEMFEALVSFEKFGFIAEVYYPICHDFRFDENGKPSSWSSSQGYCRIGYVYGETCEELIERIKVDADKLFEEFIKDDKKSKLRNAQ